MSLGRRIGNILGGLLTIALSLLLILNPQDGFPLVAAILSLSLTLYGIRLLCYYFTMARAMVGGKTILILGVIALDLGMFASTLDSLPKIFVVLYLLFIHAFAGVVDVMRSMEARRMEAKSWRLNMASGVVNIVSAALCVAFLRSVDMIVCIYSAGLFYSGCVRIVSAFRRTAVVYIQ